MTAYPLTAGVTLLVVLLLFYTMVGVGQARKRFGIRAPAISGHEAFERAYRVQMNSLEWATMFLPTLWLLAAYVADRAALAVGLCGLAGRLWYALAYVRNPAARSGGFMLGMLAFAAAGLGAGIGVARVVFGF
ncbi:MAPEG family protein [Niveibacterium sp. SC-1]|uniref:MAPEG family protein n=1 Tax=Niveibacterium sp. SC-1 TaxID=3135646 RepID=UPI00311E416C